jgi:phenylalanyl-tRNA synthetase beta subunit
MIASIKDRKIRDAARRLDVSTNADVVSELGFDPQAMARALVLAVEQRTGMPATPEKIRWARTVMAGMLDELDRIELEVSPGSTP